MNCFCIEKRVTVNFKSLQEYYEFEISLKNDKNFNKIPVDSSYSNVGLIESWFECNKCKKKWRLVEPDPPFKGVWEEIQVNR